MAQRENGNPIQHAANRTVHLIESDARAGESLAPPMASDGRSLVFRRRFGPRRVGIAESSFEASPISVAERRARMEKAQRLMRDERLSAIALTGGTSLLVLQRRPLGK